MSYGPTLGLPSGLGSSATPRPRTLLQDESTLKAHLPKAFQPISIDNASKLSAQTFLTHGGRSYAPGGFSSSLRPRTRGGDEYVRPQLHSTYRSEYQSIEPTDSDELKLLKQQLNVQERLRDGSENLLDALNPKTQKERRIQAVGEAHLAAEEIKKLKARIDLIKGPANHGVSKHRPKKLDLTAPFRPSSYAASAEPTPMPPLQEVQAPTVTLSTILQELETQGMQPDYYITRANHLVLLFSQHQTLRYDLVWGVFGQRLQMLLLSGNSDIVAAGFRIARHAITDRSSLKILRRLRTDNLVTISLLKDHKATVEREQALKFVRAFLEVSDGFAELSKLVIRTVISVADHVDDKLNGLAIETLAELLLRDPKTLVETDGLPSLLSAFADGKYQASEGILSVLLYLLDHPETRQYLPSAMILEMVMTGLIDPRMCDDEESILQAQAKIISSILKSWPGLLCLGVYNFRSIRGIVHALVCPTPMTQNIILDLIFDVLRIQSPPWSSEFLAGRRLTVTSRRAANLRPKAPSKQRMTKELDSSTEDRNLVDHYRTLLLVILLHVGLIQILIQVIEEDQNPGMRRKAMLLLGETLKLASRRLPPASYETMFMLPALFNTASAFDNPDRLDSTNAMYQIESVNRTLLRSGSTVREPLSSILRAGKLIEPVIAGGRTIELLPLSEESELKDLIERSLVTSHTKHEKWNWNLIAQLIDGPLTDGRRVEEASKNDRFFSRLLKFYRPFKYKFSELEGRSRNQQYVTIGCALVRALLQTTQGLKVLDEHQLFNQIGECLAQLDPYSGITSTDNIFSRERLKSSLTYGYIQMLGVLSSEMRGLEIMTRWKMNTALYHILDLEDRDDLIILILESFEFSLPGHTQIFLSKALTTCSQAVRTYATGLLARFCISDLPDTQFRGEILEKARWSIRHLIDQLYDPDIKVCELAIKILDNASNKLPCLDYIVYCRPALEHLGEIGEPLLLRFLSTSAGYQYLIELNYIEQQMDGWLLGGNENYVNTVEACLTRSLQGHIKPMSNLSEDESDLSWNDPAHLPPHFYRELAQTDEGCQLLESKRHFSRFANTIRDHGLEATDPESILKVKGCLWAVGNVGSMILGSRFLQGSDVVDQIIKIATQSEVLTVKGTAFYVLGLISRSLNGMEMLAEAGWDSAATVMGRSRGYVLPPKLGTFFSIKPWESYVIPIEPEALTITSLQSDADEDQLARRLIRAICELGNSVLAKRAVGEINAIHAKKPELFRSSSMYHRVMQLMAIQNCKFQARWFVMDLWDKDFVKAALQEESDLEDETRPRALTT